MGGRYKPIAFWCLMKTSHTGQSSQLKTPQYGTTFIPELLVLESLMILNTGLIENLKVQQNQSLTS